MKNNCLYGGEAIFGALCLSAIFASAVLPADCGGLDCAGRELSAKGVVVNGKTETKCEWRSFGDGCAVRYVLPEGARRISRELTEWTLPEGATVWFQVTDKDGFADYESLYESCRVGDIAKGRVLALPMTATPPTVSTHTRLPMESSPPAQSSRRSCARAEASRRGLFRSPGEEPRK